MVSKAITESWHQSIPSTAFKQAQVEFQITKGLTNIAFTSRKRLLRYAWIFLFTQWEGDSLRCLYLLLWMGYPHCNPRSKFKHLHYLERGLTCNVGLRALWPFLFSKCTMSFFPCLQKFLRFGCRRGVMFDINLRELCQRVPPPNKDTLHWDSLV